MKVETFDREYQICFVEKAPLKDMAQLVHRYREYRISTYLNSKSQKDPNDSDYLKFSRTSTANFQGCDSIKSDTNKDTNTFLLTPFNLYYLEYRWIASLKMIIFKQANHLKPFNIENVLYRFELRGNFDYKINKI